MGPLVTAGLRLLRTSWVAYAAYFIVPGHPAWLALAAHAIAAMGLWDLLVALWMSTRGCIQDELGTRAGYRRARASFRRSMTDFEQSMEECRQSLAHVRMMQEGFLPVASCPRHGLVWTAPGQDRVKALSWHRSCAYREIGRDEPPRQGKSDLSLLMLAEVLQHQYPPGRPGAHVHEVGSELIDGAWRGSWTITVQDGEQCIICAERAGYHDYGAY